MKTYLADTWLLTQLRWQLSWNTFRARKTGAKVLTVLGLLSLIAFGVFLSGGAGIVAGLVLRRFPDSGFDILLPGLILTAATALILFSSFGIALSSLFLTSDLELLMTAPLDRRAVFTSKILNGMVFYYALGAVLALPALVTYGAALGYGPLFYLFAVLTLIGTPLFPAAVAAIAVMIVARFAPARRVREVLGLMGALFGISCGLLGQTTRFWIRDVVGPGTRPEQLLGNLRFLEGLPLPSIVAGRGLSAAGSGDLVTATIDLSGFLLVTFGLFAACVLLADNLYATGWVRMQSSGSSKRTQQRINQAAQRRGLLGKASAWGAIAIKDWHIMPRDLRNFAQMLSPLLFLPVVYLNILGGRNSRSIGDLFNGRGFDPAGLFVASGVLISVAFVFGRIADTSISREGKAWWILKSAPISPFDILRGKYIAAFAPFVLVSSILMLGAEVWKGFSLVGFLYGWYGIEVVGAALLAIQVGVSVPWARLDWDDPRRMSSGWGSLISLALWLVMAVFAGGSLCLPLLADIMNPSVEAWAVVLGLVMSTLVCAIAILSSFSFGVSKLLSVGES